MIATVSGFPFDIQPAELLTEEDRESISRLSSGPLIGGGAERTPEDGVWPVFLDESFPEAEGGSAAPGPASVSVEGSVVRVTGGRLSAEIDPPQKTVRVHRRAGQDGSLPIVLRVALCCRLPMDGGLPIHAAGVATPAGAVVFFGPSGAGKSTIASTAPYPVLSDEFVVVAAARGRFEAAASGFWGTLDGGRAPRGFVPLRALVELEKGRAYDLRRLSRREALVRLLGVITVPVSSIVWSAALGVLGRVLEEVPVYRMAWTPARPPWEELRAALNRDVASEFSTQSSGA